MFMRVAMILVLGFALPAFAKDKIAQKTENQMLSPPAQGKAQIIFLRPSKYFSSMLTYLYEKRDDHDAFISAIGGMHKVVYNVEPGSRVFVSSNGIGTHFMNATVEAGKRYYVLVRPIHGYGFQLRPLRKDGSTDYNTRIPEFADWLKETIMVETPESHALVLRQQVRSNIDPTYNKGLAEWNAKTSEQISELTLNADDGFD